MPKRFHARHVRNTSPLEISHLHSIQILNMSTQTFKPIYIAAANNGPVVASFKERGIQHLMPGAVDDVPIFITVCRSFSIP